MKNLNQLAQRIHAQNKNWWINLETGEPLQRNEGELLMLVITELAEAVQGMRKDLMDDHLPHRKMEEVEMADAFIRLLDFAGGLKLELFIVHVSQYAYLRSIRNKVSQILAVTKSVVDAHYRDEQDASDAVSIAIAHIDEYCRIHHLDLEGAMEEKLAYNLKRADHSIEQRKLKDGKKF